MEIFSPHYSGLRDGNQITIRENYLPPDYQPGTFHVFLSIIHHPLINLMNLKKHKAKDSTSKLLVIGWREIVALPNLGISQIKAKIDTGARSSALHAYHVEKFQRDEQEMIRFQVHPDQRDTKHTVTAEAELLEYREVRNSGGQVQLRPAILTTIELNGLQWQIELTLTNRDVMGFRMLLGRQAVRDRFLVAPGKSFLQSNQHPKQ